VNARGLAAFAAAMPWKCADSVARGRSPPAWVDTPAMGPDRWWIEMHDMRAFRSIRSIDEAIARLASRLGGVVDRAQLSALGLGRGAIRHRIDVGRLRPLYPGVYAVGHEAIQTRGRLAAGLLVAGPGAALSHRTAAALRKLTPSMPQCVEITTTSTRPRDRPGLIFHCATRLDATSRHELPVTSPIRTLLDLAATRPRQEVERACSEALVHELVTVDAIAGQHGRGSAVLRRIVADGVAPRAQSSSAASSRRCCEPASHVHRSTPRSGATRWTSSGPTDASSSSSTATASTVTGLRSSATGAATRSCSCSATRSCASRGGSSATSRRS
jgi:hypothetical protein